MRRNKIYELCVMSTIVKLRSNQIWHEQVGHIGFAVLKEIHKMNMMADFTEITYMQKTCEACMMGKQQRKYFPHENINRVVVHIELIHAYICGKMSTISLGGSSYFLLTIDYYSRKMWIYIF